MRRFLRCHKETRSSRENEEISKVQIQDLAGEWEYEEASVAYRLTLDRNGNGNYEWKQGRFATTSLKNGLWIGTWHQRDNDREGGFELQLAQDLRSARGRWWYTRIEQDHDPLNPGGTFRLTRLPVEVSEN